MNFFKIKCIVTRILGFIDVAWCSLFWVWKIKGNILKGFLKYIWNQMKKPRIKYLMEEMRFIILKILDFMEYIEGYIILFENFILYILRKILVFIKYLIFFFFIWFLMIFILVVLYFLWYRVYIDLLWTFHDCHFYCTIYADAFYRIFLNHYRDWLYIYIYTKTDYFFFNEEHLEFYSILLPFIFVFFHNKFWLMGLFSCFFLKIIVLIFNCYFIKWLWKKLKKWIWYRYVGTWSGMLWLLQTFGGVFKNGYRWLYYFWQYYGYERWVYLYKSLWMHEMEMWTPEKWSEMESVWATEWYFSAAIGYFKYRHLKDVPWYLFPYKRLSKEWSPDPLEWGMLQRFLKYSYKSVDLGVFSFYGSGPHKRWGMFPLYEIIIDMWEFLFEDWDETADFYGDYRYIDDLCLPIESHLEHPTTRGMNYVGSYDFIYSFGYPVWLNRYIIERSEFILNYLKYFNCMMSFTSEGYLYLFSLPCNMIEGVLTDLGYIWKILWGACRKKWFSRNAMFWRFCLCRDGGDFPYYIKYKKYLKEKFSIYNVEYTRVSNMLWLENDSYYDNYIENFFWPGYVLIKSGFKRKKKRGVRHGKYEFTERMYGAFISGYVDSGYNLIMEKIYPTGERLCFPLNRHLYNVFDWHIHINWQSVDYDVLSDNLNIYWMSLFSIFCGNDHERILPREKYIEKKVDDLLKIVDSKRPKEDFNMYDSVTREVSEEEEDVRHYVQKNLEDFYRNAKKGEKMLHFKDVFQEYDDIFLRYKEVYVMLGYMMEHWMWYDSNVKLEVVAKISYYWYYDAWYSKYEEWYTKEGYKKDVKSFFADDEIDVKEGVLDENLWKYYVGFQEVGVRYDMEEKKMVYEDKKIHRDNYYKTSILLLKWYKNPLLFLEEYECWILSEFMSEDF